jgi:hypothetical protein
MSILLFTLAAFLYNYLRNDACHWTEEDLNISVDNTEGSENLRRIGGNASLNVLEARDRFINYFNSDAGSVDWKFSKIREGRRLHKRKMIVTIQY